MGLKIVERVSLVTAPTDAARSYLRTKKGKIGPLTGASVMNDAAKRSKQVETLAWTGGNTVVTAN